MSLLEEGRLMRDLSDMVRLAGRNEQNGWCCNLRNVQEVIV